MIVPLPDSHDPRPGRWGPLVADEHTARFMRKLWGAEIMETVMALAAAEERGEDFDEELVRRLQVGIACRDEWEPGA